MSTLFARFRYLLYKKKLLCLLLTLLLPFSFSACRDSVDYTQFVSELRGNIFLAETEEFSLRIFSIRKENPYRADGIPQETSERTEIYLTAQSGNKACHISFSVNGKNYGGDMSFDNVKTEYYYSCTLDTSNERELICALQYGEAEHTLTAVSVKTSDTLPPMQVLAELQKTEAELFASMTDKYGFAGEIYLRLIYEDAPYYYVGVIDRQGEVNAFLINAKTGEILAKRKT